MDLIVAKEIALFWFQGHKIDAIKTLRREVALGLLEAKNFLERNCRSEQEMVDSIMREFALFTPEEQLRVAREDMRTASMKVAKLEMEQGITVTAWDERDHENRLPLLMAHLVAAKVSGLPIEQVTPTMDDVRLAEALARRIEWEAKEHDWNRERTVG